MFKSNFQNPLDTTLYHFINGLSGYNRFIDDIFIFFANDALEIYAVLFVISWFALSKQDLKNRHTLIISGLSGILALLFNVVISHIWFRPRPFTFLNNAHQLIPHSSDASFPSDHTSGSFGFAAGLSGHCWKWLRYTFIGVAVLTMFSRVYVGVHYPTDVIGAMIVGTISGKIIKRLSNSILPISTFIVRLFKYGPSLDTKGSSHSS